jgi:hypothetical protein
MPTAPTTEFLHQNMTSLAPPDRVQITTFISLPSAPRKREGATSKVTERNEDGLESGDDIALDAVVLGVTELPWSGSSPPTKLDV